MIDQVPEQYSRGILAWFAQNRFAADMLMVMILVGGFVAARSLPETVFPDLDPRVINIVVPYPGSTPDEVEEGINRRIEEAITGIEGIERVRSVAREGSGSVTAELEDDANDRDVLDDIKSAVEQIQDFPPEDAENPRISDVTLISRVMSIALYGDVPERTLRELAFDTRDELTTLEEVSMASVSGVRAYEVGIEVSERSLREYGLTFEEVARAARSFSINLPGGTMRTESGDILLRADAQAYRRADFEEIALATAVDGTVITLGDVAEIVDGFESVDSLSLFDGKPAAFVNVSRIGDQRALEIEEAVQAYVSRMVLPAGVSASAFANEAKLVRDRTNMLVRNGLIGLTLVFGCLLLFLNMRLAFWTSMGIPISFMGGFIVMYALGGSSINMVSLFAFILVLGVVVDDAIVVGENIYAKMEQGLKPQAAAIVGLRDILPPVVIGILTSVAAFTPMLFVSGMMGQMLSPISIVVISVLMFSLVEAMFILPSHLSRVDIAHSTGRIDRAQARLRGVLESFVRRVYQPLLRYTLRKPVVIVASGAALLLFALGIVLGGHMKFIFVEHTEGELFIIDLKMPVGTPYEETYGNMRALTEAIRSAGLKFDEERGFADEGESVIESISTFIGTSPFSADIMAVGNSAIQSHLGQIIVELMPAELRNIKITEIERRVIEELGELPAAEITYSYDQFSVGADIAVELSHSDPEALLDAVERTQEEVARYPGVMELKDSFDLGKRELNLELTDEGLASGLTLGSLARQVRQAYYGEEVQRIQRGRDEVKVLVRYTDSERRDVSSIYDMRVRLNDGTEVPFRSVARVSEGRGYSTIDRSDRKRVVSVTAKVDDALANATEINAALRTQVLPAIADEIRGLVYSFEGEDKERREGLESLAQGMAFSVLVIFAILSVQLKSYTQPLIIMSVIPFGFVGAILGHMALGYMLSMISLMGLIALSGVVVNDSLILMDKINKTRDKHVGVDEAIISAASARFRPIFFTTLTTFVGLAPMMFEQSTNARFMIPMAISLAFGIVFATTITLLLVPALYKIRYNFMEWMRRRQGDRMHLIRTREELLDGWGDEWEADGSPGKQ